MNAPNNYFHSTFLQRNQLALLLFAAPTFETTRTREPERAVYPYLTKLPNSKPAQGTVVKHLFLKLYFHCLVSSLVYLFGIALCVAGQRCSSRSARLTPVAAPLLTWLCVCGCGHARTLKDSFINYCSRLPDMGIPQNYFKNLFFFFPLLSFSCYCQSWLCCAVRLRWHALFFFGSPEP